MYTGELISLSVAISWTFCALFAEVASKRMGSLPLNVIRMALSLLMLVGVMWVFTGHPYPYGADTSTWFWLLLSGLIGYVLGDFCLFNCYILIGSRYGQLLMTLAPAAAAISGRIILGQSMAWTKIAGMIVTMTGIALSLYRKPSGDGRSKKLPAKGIIFGAIAGTCQGIGLVCSAKGLTCYEASLLHSGIDPDSMRNLIPFSSTAIRAVMGLLGFTLWTLLSGHSADLGRAVRDSRGMLFALGATITGPFIGVSLSLMATLYTEAGIAQTIMALTPILIILPTWLIFNQRVTIKEIIGALVAVSGVSMFFLF